MGGPLECVVLKKRAPSKASVRVIIVTGALWSTASSRLREILLTEKKSAGRMPGTVGQGSR